MQSKLLNLIKMKIEKYLKNLIFCLIFFIANISSIKGQDALDIQLKKLETTHNQYFDKDEYLFDRFNCILFIGSYEVPLNKVKIEYIFVKKNEHYVHVSCLEGKCIFDPTQSDEHQNINGKLFEFREKAKAIYFTNKFNEFINTCKIMGYCN